MFVQALILYFNYIFKYISYVSHQHQYVTGYNHCDDNNNNKMQHYFKHQTKIMNDDAFCMSRSR